MWIVNTWSIVEFCKHNNRLDAKCSIVAYKIESKM